MPHLVFHMSFARDIAAEIASPAIDSDRGAYYLGATGPDMHVLSRSDRQASHYFDLECMTEQDSVQSFLNVNADTRRERSGATAAFVAGYLTHLVVDEVWVVDIYRPCFGPASPLGGDAKANLMDRVLQYDMDLQRRVDRTAADEIEQDLRSSSLQISLDFLDDAILRQWREVAVDMVSREPGWERFRFLAGRYLRAAGVGSDDELDTFFETVPQLLEQTKRHVGKERIDGFLARSRELSLKTLREYLA